MTDRLQRLTPAIEDVDRTVSNILSVFPELRMHSAYLVMLIDEEGRGRALKGNSALEGAAPLERAQFAAFLRACANAYDDPEHHHIDAHLAAAEAEGSN